MLRQRILDFLYEQVKSNKISQIKKGMVEEFEAFIEGIFAEKEAAKSAERVLQTRQQLEEPKSES